MLSETLIVGLDDTLSAERDDLTSRYSYNSFGQVQSQKDARGQMVSTAYNEDGTVKSTTDAAGNTVD